MLKRVHVRGYKCLRDISVDLGPFTVLVGRNDSGKSSFLQALAEPSLALLRWDPSDVAAVSEGDWTLALEGESGTFLFEAAHFAKPRFRLPTGEIEPLNFLSRRLAEIWFARHTELVASDPVSLDPRHIAAHSSAAEAALAPFVASRGAGTAAHLASLALGDRRRFDAVERALREATEGRIESLVVKDVGASTYALSFKLEGGSVVAARQMSEGVLLFVGFQALIQRESLPGVLLVEEPERGLHPQRLVDVLGALRALSALGTQVIFTTHSPDVLGACTPDEVRVFHRAGTSASTEVRALDSGAGEAREPLGQIWSAHGAEGLLAISRPAVPALGE